MKLRTLPWLFNKWGNEYGLVAFGKSLEQSSLKDPVECSLWLDGSWYDTLYDAVFFMGGPQESPEVASQRSRNLYVAFTQVWPCPFPA